MKYFTSRHITLMLFLASGALLVVSCSNADFGAARGAANQGDYATAWKELKGSANSLRIGPWSKSDVEKGRDAANRGDYTTAWREWKPLADRGDAEAQYNIGLMYLRGDGVSQDLQEAKNWLERAASNGHQKALWELNSSGSNYRRDYAHATRGPLTDKYVTIISGLKDLEQKGRNMKELRATVDTDKLRQCGVLMRQYQKQLEELAPKDHEFGYGLSLLGGEIGMTMNFAFETVGKCVSCREDAAEYCDLAQLNIEDLVERVWIIEKQDADEVREKAIKGDR